VQPLTRPLQKLNKASTQSPLQHGIASLHASLSSAHELCVPQVPLVAPSGMLQTAPAQQSLSTVHVSPPAAHCATQVPLATSQLPEQHCPSAAQVEPFGTQSTHRWLGAVPRQSLLQQSESPEQASPVSVQAVVSRPQRNSPPPAFWQEAGAQHARSSAPSQIPPTGVHVGASAVQRSTPSAPGTHGAPPQHWSRNWHTLALPVPGGMQQLGSFAS
jgi:hypothetical protein